MYGQQPELRVSIPLEHVSASKLCTPDTTEPESLVVSYALSDVHVHVTSVNLLHEQLSRTTLPTGMHVGTCTFHCCSLTPTVTQCLTPLFSGWTDATELMQCLESLFLCKLGKADRPEVTLSLVVHNNLS